MAYFSNCCEGEVLHNECADCILGQKCCPIATAQSLYNYDACNNPTAKAILNLLVKQDEDYTYLGCQLKPFLDRLRKG